jgi:hypothetical protein
MVKFLTTRNIESAIEDTIKQARFKLLLVTPFVQTHHTIIERLTDASRRNVSIEIVCREEELKESQKKELVAIDNLTLWFMEHLHAKCYANESQMVLTSMNLYDASRKNREMGVLVDSNHPAYNDAMQEVASIVANSTMFSPNGKQSPSKNILVDSKRTSNKRRQQTKDSFCIRCLTPVKGDPEKPFCSKCYKSWAIYKNEEYEEKYCHSCGSTSARISKVKPKCYACWKGN